MEQILLFMWRKTVAQVLIEKLKDKTALPVLFEDDYEALSVIVGKTTRSIVIIEAMEQGKYDLPFCNRLAKQIRSLSSNSKILLFTAGPTSTAEHPITDENSPFDCILPFQLSIDDVRKEILAFT